MPGGIMVAVWHLLHEVTSALHQRLQEEVGVDGGHRGSHRSPRVVELQPSRPGVPPPLS